VLARVDTAAIEGAAAAAEAESSLAALAEEAVARITDELGMRARVSVTEDDETVRVTASAPDVGMLIGRDGRTIDAVQHIVSSIAYRQEGPDGKAVEVDAGGYRERRRSRLEATARAAASRALRDGEPVRLEPMSAAERRIVHLTLQDDEGLETHSEGDDPDRYVVVSPA
jgi:spoIIIJ-associated protein